MRVGVIRDEIANWVQMHPEHEAALQVRRLRDARRFLEWDMIEPVADLLWDAMQPEDVLADVFDMAFIAYVEGL